MNEIIIYLRDFNVLTVLIRLVLAMLLGGILGLERGRKKRPAGFRTYMLVCVGAALVMTTSQYILEQFNTGDPARLGAQVISGIGFLGAGTIIVTGRNQVRGLTTAAGLWAAACMGLAVGIGFYEGAIISCLMLLITLSVFHKFDEYMRKKSTIIDFFVEFDSIQCVGSFINLMREKSIRVSNIELSKNKIQKDGTVAAVFTIELQVRRPHSEVFALLSSCEGVKYIEEME